MRSTPMCKQAGVISKLPSSAASTRQSRERMTGSRHLAAKNSQLGCVGNAQVILNFAAHSGAAERVAMPSDLERLQQENEGLKALLAADPYNKIEELGRGGFCTASRATKKIDAEHEVEVCLKELHPELRSDPQMLSYFRREAQIASSFRSKNIVRLIDADFSRFRLVYELVDGVDLRRLLEHAGGKLAPEFVILIGLGGASALEQAHCRMRRGALAAVIHRDLTPANILVSFDGNVKLADFGTAALGSSVPQTSRRGTPEYMSPEQARGRTLDPATDVFSLGVVMYELLTGKRPFDGDGDGPKSFERLLTGTYEPLESVCPDTPRPLIAVIAQMLQPERAERPSASEVTASLAAIAPPLEVERALGKLSYAARKRKTLSGATAPAPPPSEARIAQVTTARQGSAAVGSRWLPRRTVLASTAFTALASTMIFVGWPTFQFQSPSTPEIAHAESASRTPLAAVEQSARTVDIAPAVTETDVHSMDGQPTSISAPVASADPRADASAAPVGEAPARDSTVAPQKTYLSVGADKSAPVWIDGHLMGRSPVERTSVTPGSHKVVVGEGLQQKTVSAIATAGKTTKVFVRLRRPTN